MFGFLAFTAPLSIRPRRRFRNKHHFNRQKIRRRFAKNPKSYAQSKVLCVQPAGPLAGPQGWRVPRHRLSGFGLDRLPTARRISRQAPSVEKRTGAFVFLTGITRRAASCVLAYKWAVPGQTSLRDAARMSHRRHAWRYRTATGELPADLYVMPDPWPRPGRPAKHDVEAWRVIDDWPQRVPVTQAEIDVFEAWFGDLFDEFFGPL